MFPMSRFTSATAVGKEKKKAGQGLEGLGWPWRDAWLGGRGYGTPGVGSTFQAG